jgi:hypothetical protein
MVHCLEFRTLWLIGDDLQDFIVAAWSLANSDSCLLLLGKWRTCRDDGSTILDSTDIGYPSPCCSAWQYHSCRFLSQKPLKSFGIATMTMELVSQDKHPFLLALLALSQALLAARVGDWIVLLAVFLAIGFHVGDGRLWGRPDQHQYKWYEPPQEKGQLQNKPKKTRDIGQKLHNVGCDLVILWGSQSGVSEAFAERLARLWHSRYGLKTLVADLDDYDASSLSNLPTGKLCVFLCSTYGEGDPPDNAANFCATLAKMRTKSTRIDGLCYLALGMGNRNYKHYNQVITVSNTPSADINRH